jgi:transcriptional regulator with XRE-family HTH domain
MLNMALVKILKFVSNENKNRPNKITLYIGEAVRKAREEKGLSQAKLAKTIYLRRATLSDIENGKTEPDASTLMLLGHTLEKPVAYFLPDYLYIKQKHEDLSPLESELIMQFRNIWDDHLRRLAIKQVKVLSDFEPEEMLVDSIGLIAGKFELDDNVIELINKRKKK